jgi:predicted dehydrogenase
LEAVYIPLANHLHVEWARKAAEAGKHVLCEKPIALSAKEAETLLAVRDRTGVKIMEAFMVRTHPQWLGTRDLLRSGKIGKIRAIQSFYGYTNVDPENIRNRPDVGGGGLMDIGCYNVTTARFVMEAEPTRVLAAADIDPTFGTDRLFMGILDFSGTLVTIGCGTQQQSRQRCTILGENGQLELEIAVTPPPERPARTTVTTGSPLDGFSVEPIEYPPCNQYTIQGDLFSEAIRNGTPQVTPLEDAVANMRVLDALVRSAESGRWETV